MTNDAEREGNGPAMVMMAGLQESMGLKSPLCPLCGASPVPSVMVMSGGTQAMCTNDRCEVLTWTPQETAAQFLLEAHYLVEDLRPDGSIRWRRPPGDA